MTWKGRSEPDPESPEPDPESNGRQWRPWEEPLAALLKFVVTFLKFVVFLFAAAVVFGFISVVVNAEPAGGAASVVDGDTLRWRGERVRFVGMDAPECRQTCQRSGGAAY